ncbi:MAG: hypothetical protein ACP5JU_03360 [Minisyncoccia bacterium]
MVDYIKIGLEKGYIRIDEKEDKIYYLNTAPKDKVKRFFKTEDKWSDPEEKVLSKATLGQRGSYAQGESVRPQYEAVLEELRTDKTHPLHEVVSMNAKEAHTIYGGWMSLWKRTLPN